MARAWTRKRAALAATLAVAALASGCGIGGASDDGDTVRVYTGRHYGVEHAFAQFTEETGIEVDFLFGNDAELRERIEAEGEDTQADVYMTVDAGNLAVGAEQGMFQPTDSEAIDAAIPANLRDPEGLWFGLSVRARTIVYNPAEVSPDELSTYEDLADPRWKGRLCMRNSPNVYTQSLVASLIAHHGYDEALRVVKGWVGNDTDIMATDVLILEAISQGACDVGITNHYYLAREYAEDPEFPVELVWANQADRGVHMNVSGAGVARHADNPELGRQLIEWLATDGQGIFVDGNHEYPANPEVPAEPLITERFGTDFRRDDLAAATFGGLNADAIRLMDEAGYA
ncbi:MAG: extracellular solute-binding protein [Acidimicrobiia bacterium]|nr:extracellular solute-binding protein [Acidimicrobiia bacterium]